MTWQPSSRFVEKEPSVWERIEAVYGKPFAELKAPEGWRFKFRNGLPEMRIPKLGEDLLGHDGTQWRKDRVFQWTDAERLILEPIPAPTPKRYTITLEETGEVRNPESGEFFIGDNGKPCFADRRFLVLRFPILRVVSREAK